MFLAKAKADHLSQPEKLNVPDLRPDLVEREFKAQGPNKLWVADICVCAHEERLCVRRVCHRRLLPTDRWVGVIRLDAHRSTAAASSQPGNRVC